MQKRFIGFSQPYVSVPSIYTLKYLKTISNYC